MFLVFLVIKIAAAVESCINGEICIEKCCPIGQMFGEDYSCITRYGKNNQWYSFLLFKKRRALQAILILFFFTSDTIMLPETGLENHNRSFTFVDTFMEDYLDYHPRLEECINVYFLEEDEEWSILDDGTLHHKNVTASTPLYCIESIIV